MLHTVIGDKRWKLIAKRLKKGIYGRCDYDERRIVIRRGLDSEDLIRTAAHEATHAAFPFMDEDAVGDFEDVLADVLINKFGATVDPREVYRRLGGK